MVRRSDAYSQRDDDICPHYDGTPGSCRNSRCRLAHVAPLQSYGGQQGRPSANGSVFAARNTAEVSGGSVFARSTGSAFGGPSQQSGFGSGSAFGQGTRSAFGGHSQQGSSSGGSAFGQGTRSVFGGHSQQQQQQRGSYQAQPPPPAARPPRAPATDAAAAKSDNPFAALTGGTLAKPKEESLVDTLLRTLGREAPDWKLSGYGEAGAPNLFVGDVSFEEARWNFHEHRTDHGKWWAEHIFQQDTLRAEILKNPGGFIQAVQSGRKYSVFEVDLSRADLGRAKEQPAPKSSPAEQRQQSTEADGDAFREIWAAPRFEFGRIPVCEPPIEFR